VHVNDLEDLIAATSPHCGRQQRGADGTCGWHSDVDGVLREPSRILGAAGGQRIHPTRVTCRAGSPMEDTQRVPGGHLQVARAARGDARSGRGLVAPHAVGLLRLRMALLASRRHAPCTASTTMLLLPPGLRRVLPESGRLVHATRGQPTLLLKILHAPGATHEDPALLVGVGIADVQHLEGVALRRLEVP